MMIKVVLATVLAAVLLLSACSNTTDSSSSPVTSETKQTESIGANNSSTNYFDSDSYNIVDDPSDIIDSQLEYYKEKGYTIDMEAGYVYTDANGFDDDFGRDYGSEGIVIIDRLTDEKVVTIPETINGKKVVGCLNDVFIDFDEKEGHKYVPCEKIYFPKNMKDVYIILSGAPDLVEVVLPQNQMVIRSNMFNKCKKLSSFVLPDSVELIEEGAFSYCESLDSSLVLPKNLTIVEKEAFMDCTSLTEIQFDDNLEEIGDFAFHGCDSLTNVTLPEKVKHIGNYCFGHCDKLCEITLPESLTEIGKSAFSQTKLTHIVIPSKIAVINEKTFSVCKELSEVVLNDGLQRIEKNAFNSCTSLKEIYIPETVEYISEDAFNKCKDVTIKGKSGSYAENYAKEQGYEFIAS